MDLVGWGDLVVFSHISKRYIYNPLLTMEVFSVQLRSSIVGFGHGYLHAWRGRPCTIHVVDDVASRVMQSTMIIRMTMQKTKFLSVNLSSIAAGAMTWTKKCIREKREQKRDRGLSIYCSQSCRQ